MRRRLMLVALTVWVGACSAQADELVAPSARATFSADPSAPSSAGASLDARPVGALPPGVDWPGFGYDDANSFHVTGDTALSSDSVAALEPAWRIDGIGGVSGTPVVADGIVYFGDWHGILHAVRLSDGSVAWETDLPDDNAHPRELITSTPLVTETRVFVSDLGGFLHAVDRSTGTPVWSVALEGDLSRAAAFSSPVEADGRIVIGTVSMPPDSGGSAGFRGTVLALDGTTGSELWRVAVGSSAEGAGTAIGIWSSAAIDRERGLAFIGTGNTNRGDPLDSRGNELMAIDYRTGEVAWEYRFVRDATERDMDVGAAPNLLTVDGRDVVGVGCKCGDYALFDRDSGEVVWRVHLVDGGPAGGIMAPAAIGNEAIYVHAYDFTSEVERELVVALDARDGTSLWTRDWLDPDWAAPGNVLVNDVLFQAASRTIVALAADTGELLWSRELPGSIGGGISVASGHVLVGYNTGWDFNPPADGGLTAFILPSR
jgi:polyvinyl alcohol dehydrogenase (cytochrome)